MKNPLKTNKWFHYLIIISMILLKGVFADYCHGVEPDVQSSQIVILVSKNIRPYVEAVDGCRARLETLMDAEVEIFMLDRYSEEARRDLADRLTSDDKVDLMTAIGPEAAMFAWEFLDGAGFPKIFSVILNPGKVIHNIESAAGIPLNIPPEDQMGMIRRGLPTVERLGIFYDPRFNSDFFDAAAGTAPELNIDLVPMSVSSKKDIPFLLEECWDSVDCIWLIPDRTVISESIAQYIIKQALLKRVPVVGYNQFFYGSGAAMAFVFDYADLGRQTADLIVYVIQHQHPVVWNPVFNVLLNETVLKKLGIELPKPVELPMMVGP